MTAMANPRHRVSVAVAHARSEIDAVADASVWSMDRDETTATLTEITRLRSKLGELELRVVEHADDAAIDAWTHATRQTRASVRGQERLAFALTERHHLRAALAAGDLLVDQARVIVDALDTLPTDLHPDLVVTAEQHLVGAAREHDARALRILGRRLLEVVAPDLADAHEATLLERGGRRARGHEADPARQRPRPLHRHLRHPHLPRRRAEEAAPRRHPAPPPARARAAGPGVL